MVISSLAAFSMFPLLPYIPPILFFLTNSNMAIKLFLQCMFLAMSLTQAITIFLKLINFAYYDAFSNNQLLKTALISFFGYFYLTVETTSLGHCILALSYICSFYICIYVYDCGMNIGDWYVENVRGYYWYQVAGYVLFTMITPLIIMHKSRKNDEKQFVFLLIQVTAIALLNAIQNKHIVYSAIFSTMIFSTILFRYVFNLSQLTKSLQFQLIPLVMMALDSQFKQSNSKKVNSEEKNWRYSYEFLKLSIYFVLFSYYNQKIATFELVLGVFVALGPRIVAVIDRMKND